MRIRVLPFTVLLLAGAVLVFRFTFSAVPASVPLPTWSAKSGSPTPGSFLFAMFPETASVPKCDAPSGNPIGTLDRAVTNSQAELDAGGWVQVNESDTPPWIELNRLTFLPPKQSDRDYFAAFVTAYKSRHPHQRSDASLTLADGPNGATLARLKLRPDDNHIEEYIYSITVGKPKPLEMYQIFGPGEALADIDRPLIALAASVAFLLTAGATVITAAYIKTRTAKKAKLAKP